MEQETRRDPRAPIRVRVRYRSATVEEFLEESSVDLSASGLFVGTREPMGVGTLVKFELVLSDDSSVVEGVGRVVWVRNPLDLSTADDPPGMGLKFVKMDPACRARVEAVVERRAAEGRYERGASPADLVPSEAPTGGFPDPSSSVAPRVYEADGGAVAGDAAAGAPALEPADLHRPDDEGADPAPAAPTAPEPAGARQGVAPAGGHGGVGTAAIEAPPVEDAAAVAALAGEPPDDRAASSEGPAPPEPAALAPVPAVASAPPAPGREGAPAGPREPTPFPPETSAPTWVLPGALMLAGLVALGVALWIALG